MNKEELQKVFNDINDNEYNWSMHFFRIDRRNRIPYLTYKVRFKNSEYLSDYAANVVNATLMYQVNTLKDIQEYNGYNTKVSCDKISVEDELIKEQYDNFCTALENSSENKIEEKIMGYTLNGTPSSNDELKKITFVKVANPIISLKNKKSTTYISSSNDELDMISDDVYRLYLTVDFAIVDGDLYSFNHTFEKMFDIESTLKKVKTKAIENMLAVDAFNNKDMFGTFAKSYTSARTFITLKQERINRISNSDGRETVANMLNIELDEDKKFVINDETNASLLIRYLCYKIFRDDETKNVLEVSSITELNLRT